MVGTLNFDKWSVPWKGNSHLMLCYRASKKFPFSAELADAVLPFRWQDFIRGEFSGPKSSRLQSSRLKEWFCYRYVIINELFGEAKPAFGLDLGAGLTPRGLEACKDGYDYYEVDLPDVMEPKRLALASLNCSSVPKLVSLDLEDVPALKSLLSSLPNGNPVIIIEAIFFFLSFPAKMSVLGAVSNFARKRNGRIILSDVYLQDNPVKGSREIRFDGQATFTGPRQGYCHFESFETALAFFRATRLNVRALWIFNLELDFVLDRESLARIRSGEEIIWCLDP